ncbi:MAG TPA: LacI family DNA-binding transcriptional regulator [Jatrophihabitans sp.]|nr:LacI family DNA-binding transcriptional regulator [Jatrophihabitans sp.]
MTGDTEWPDGLHRGRPGATLAAVAARVGVSRTTVSNAYNRPDQLSAELRERILQAASELGYAGPDPVARSLRTRQADAVGLIFSGRLEYAFHDPAALEYLGGLAEACTERGRSLLMVPSQPGSSHVETVLRAVVDGFVISSTGADDELLRAVLSRPQPAVIMDAPLGVDGVDFVGIDDRAGFGLVARHIVELGHRRIGVVAVRRDEDVPAEPVPTALRDRLNQGERQHSVRRQRLLGLLDCVDTSMTVLVTERDANSREAGAAGAAALLDADPDLTAIMATSDIIAFGVQDELAGRGMDLTVTGFDDVAAAAGAGLTTVHQPLAGKGRTAIELLLDDRPRALAETRILPCSLVVRASSAPPR